jgi:chemotaxis protein methyltransferase CheR
MTGQIQQALLASISELVTARFGLNFPKERWPDLERRTADYLRSTGMSLETGKLAELVSRRAKPDELQAFANHLTIGETHFFREVRGLEILTSHIVPNWMEQHGADERRFLRIWSAGCATGEEPYSIAMALREKVSARMQRRIAVFGTDLNTNSIRIARKGIYGEWSFRGVPSALKSKYFRPGEKGRWVISPDIQQAVSFHYFNLAGDIYPQWFSPTTAMDIIYCRNVLMYLTPEGMNRAIERFHHCLAPGGWLIVSAAEHSAALASRFETVRLPGLTLYRKKPSPSVPAVTAQQDIPLPASETLVTSFSQTSIPNAGDFRTQSVERLESIISEPLDGAPEVLELARAHADQGRLDEASGWCEKAISQNRTDAGAYYLLAAIRQEQGRLEEAANLLRKALYYEPKLAVVHYALGNLFLKQRNLRDAGKHLSNAWNILADCRREDVVPQSGGLTAGRLRELVRSQIQTLKIPMPGRLEEA